METNEKVIGIIKELSGLENISLNSNLQSDIKLDSLTMVTLLIQIEDEFLIELDESDMNPFDLETVESVINLVEKYVGDKNEKEG